MARRTEDEIRDWMVQRLATELALPPEDVDEDRPFAEFGLGSVQLVGISGELEAFLGFKVKPTLLFDHPTVAALSARLAAGEAEHA